MTALGDLIQAYRDTQKYPVSDRRMAMAIGVSGQTLANWITGKSTPQPAHLRALATHIETPYVVVLEAAMVDAGYLSPGERISQ